MAIGLTLASPLHVPDIDRRYIKRALAARERERKLSKLAQKTKGTFDLVSGLHAWHTRTALEAHFVR